MKFSENVKKRNIAVFGCRIFKGYLGKRRSYDCTLVQWSWCLWTQTHKVGQLCEEQRGNTMEKTSVSPQEDAAPLRPWSHASILHNSGEAILFFYYMFYHYMYWYYMFYQLVYGSYHSGLCCLIFFSTWHKLESFGKGKLNWENASTILAWARLWGISSNSDWWGGIQLWVVLSLGRRSQGI